MKLKLAFDGAEELLDVIALVARDLNIEISGCADCTVRVKVSGEYMLKVILDGSLVTIEYGGGRAVFLRGLAIAVGSMRKGIKKQPSTRLRYLLSTGLCLICQEMLS